MYQQKLKLKNTTLVCIDSLNIEKSQYAITQCLNQCEFDDVRFFIDKVDNRKPHETYSYFMINELFKFIHTEYILVIQWDGYILNPAAWTEEFYKYDYIGAVWDYNNPESVGNGGFSFRTTKLLEAISKLKLTSPECNPEDAVICRQYREYLKKKGLKFAPIEIADKFSFETNGDNRILQKTYNQQFGFHNIYTEGLPKLD